MDIWVGRESDGCAFPDQRLKARLGTILGDLGGKIGETLPIACQDWAATKAAYRFFSNRRVDDGWPFFDKRIARNHPRAVQSS